MAKLTFNGETYTVDYAVKGADFIHGYDSEGIKIISYDGISDFSDFGYDQSYLEPEEFFQELDNIVRHHEGALKRSDGNTLSAADFGAAAATHTHTPADIGAAPANHTHAVAFTLTLPASAWGTNGWAPTEQVVNTLPHYMFDDNGVAKNLIIAPAPEFHLVWGECMVRCTGQWSTDLGFTCEDLPSVDLVAHVLIVG